MTDPRYPIGKFHRPEVIDDSTISEWIETIENHPNKLRKVVQNITEKELSTPYREGGWTVRQVIHHIGDSHLNSYMRFKWALTEDNPLIKVYDEKIFAEGIEYQAPIEISLNFIESLHAKWVHLLRNLSREDLERTFQHPEGKRPTALSFNLAIYAWHCKHHLAHVKLVTGE